MINLDEFLNLDGKDAHLELPLLNPEERLPTDTTITAASTETVVTHIFNNNGYANSSTAGPDWTITHPAIWALLGANNSVSPSTTVAPTPLMPESVPGFAVEHPKDAMDWSSIFPRAAAPTESLNPMDWSAFMTDLVFPTTATADTSSPVPLTAESAMLGTPAETPLLVDLLDATSPEFSAVSPMFPVSTTASPVFKTSPTFDATYSPEQVLGIEDAFPSGDDVVGVVSASSSSTDLGELLRAFQSLQQQQQQQTEPTVTVPVRVLQSLVQRLKSCTCCTTKQHRPAPTVIPAPLVAVAPVASLPESDPFAARRHRVPNKLYLCSQDGCNKTFTRRFNLQTHEETHNPDRPRDFICDLCNKGFTRLHDLTRHAAVHDDEKHECEGCGRGYSRSDALRRHMVKCEGLNDMTSTSGVLKQNRMAPTLVKLK